MKNTKKDFDPDPTSGSDLGCQWYCCTCLPSRTIVACAQASPGEDSVDQIPVHKIRHHSVAIVAAW